MMAGGHIRELPADEDNAPLKHYRHCQSAVQSNPPQEKCFLGGCDECPEPEHLKERILLAYDTKGTDEVQLKQWTSTDRSNLETKVMPVEEFMPCSVKSS